MRLTLPIEWAEPIAPPADDFSKPITENPGWMRVLDEKQRRMDFLYKNVPGLTIGSASPGRRPYRWSLDEQRELVRRVEGTDVTKVSVRRGGPLECIFRHLTRPGGAYEGEEWRSLKARYYEARKVLRYIETL